MKGKYPLSAMLLLSVCRQATAQDKDLASLNYTVSRLHYHDTAATARQWDAKLRIPLYQKQKSILVSALGYKNVTLRQFPDSYTATLHGLTVQGAWVYKATARHSLTLFVQAGLFSDLQDISAKDFRYSAGLRYRFRHSDRLSTGWGLAYSRQFFGNQVVPFVEADYRPNDRWRFSGQFPVKPKILYRVSRKLCAGLELNGEAASYRLSAGEKGNQFIQINQWTGLCKVEYRLAQAWQLHLGIGKQLRQTYKRYEDASTTPWTIITFPIGKKADPVEKIENTGWNIQLGISFQPFGA